MAVKLKRHSSYVAIFLSFLLLFSSMLSVAEVTPNFRVILLTENYPPYNMSVDDKNFARGDNVDGLATDIVREMFKRAGVKYSLSLRFPWKRIFELTVQKRRYGLFSTSRTPEREDLFKWVGPIASSDWVFMTLKDKPIKINNLDEARPYRIGGYKGDAKAKYLESQNFKLHLSFRDNENIKKLQAGKIDLWATGDLSGRYLAAQDNFRDLKKVFTFKKSQLYLAMNKETPNAVIEALQKALDSMEEDGTKEKITNDYL
ncbi:substrate-binding periplasmic protein [Spartinivicinus poritis]|uniref:ABC transporter substrate-binding protein n=1 Tax=Spartinivicinus poritis TaxID=2994640 RepID=A0ABT5UET3_9GAMM|nr:ABC transporter substrate-binding protein [Spartinivicinus sp. A2-2]MDE1464898.1 ABC transporter substrate-binding protein [Spartinivicinus sp. A2-2]